MKVLFICIGCFSLLSLGYNPLVDVKVVVKGCANQNGSVRLGIYNRSEDFPDPEKQWVGHVAQADKEVTFQLKMKRDSWVSFAAFHDENNNGKLDKNLVGAPTENYGFSRDARGTFSAPDYSEAVVKMTGEPIVIRIR